MRNYKRKTNQANWNEDDMKNAITAVKLKQMSLRKACKNFSVPKDSLHRRVKKALLESSTIVHTNLLGRFRKVLSDNQEKDLNKYIKDMDNSFYGLSMMDIRLIVFEFCKKNQIPNPFNKDSKLAGEDFVRGFLKRHPDLSLRKPEAISINRVFGLNEDDIKIYFSNLENLLNKYHFEPHQIFNCDESGLSCVHKPLKVILSTGKPCVSSVTSGEKGVTTTILCACNSVGQYVPPMMIFKRKKKKLLLTDYAPVGTIQGCSENGWVNTDLFFEYIQHFVKHVRCTLINKVLLILDGHRSHTKSLKLIDYARDNGLFLLSLPPHTTHKLQPLDRGFFKPLKTFFNQACMRWMRNHSGRRIQTENLGELFNEAYLRAANMENATSSFRATGIVPFNQHVLENEYPRKSLSNNNNKIRLSIPQEVYFEGDNNKESEILQQAELTTLELESGDKLKPIESFSETTVTSSSSFEDILQIPKLYHSKRKLAEKSQIITSSPYKKKILQEKNNKKKTIGEKKKNNKIKNLLEKNNGNKLNKKYIKNNKKKSKLKKCLIEKDVNNEEEWFCPVCQEKWCNGTQIDWIACSVCTVWVHEDCTLNEVCFLCE